MVSRGISFQPINYWEEYIPGPSKIETDACQEWVLSRPGVVKMIEHINEEIGLERDWWILDAGCKEGWTGEYLINEWDCNKDRQIGLELSAEQVEYAHTMKRSWVKQGNVCAMISLGNNVFDLVLSRHVLGLTEDAFQAMVEMWRVLKPGGLLYVITHIPGNIKKHYSYISNKSVVDEWLKEKVFCPRTEIHYGWNPKFNEHQDNKRKELVIFLRKDIEE